MFTSSFFRHSPLGMNYRNYIILQSNPMVSLRAVKNKASFKKVLQANGILTPTTYDEIHDFSDMPLITSFPPEFVIKPNRGFGGKGIMLLQREKNHFLNPAGDIFSHNDIKRHIRKILDGEFSSYIAQDLAIIEERIYPSGKLQFKDAYGLPDIRIVCFNFDPVMSMLRYPTLKSKGRANLAAGGIGIGIDLDTGRATYIHSKGTISELQPEDLGIPPSFVMPNWDEMKELARLCSKIASLKLTGVDLILDNNDRVRVLEVNARPGLEIQNINEDSLVERLRKNPFFDNSM